MPATSPSMSDKLLRLFDVDIADDAVEQWREVHWHYNAYSVVYVGLAITKRSWKRQLVHVYRFTLPSVGVDTGGYLIVSPSMPSEPSRTSELVTIIRRVQCYMFAVWDPSFTKEYRLLSDLEQLALLTRENPSSLPFIEEDVAERAACAWKERVNVYALYALVHVGPAVRRRKTSEEIVEVYGFYSRDGSQPVIVDKFSYVIVSPFKPERYIYETLEARFVISGVECYVFGIWASDFHGRYRLLSDLEQLALLG